MKQFCVVLALLIIALLSCDKYETERPEPVAVQFSNPGIVEFIVQQASTGKYPDLIIDTMQIQIINQSISSIDNIRYVVRGFDGNTKEYSSFSYWQDMMYTEATEPFQADVLQELSTSFKNIISYDNLEVDLLEFKMGNNLISETYSGSYTGNFTAYQDSIFQTFGLLYSWIDYKGAMTTYFDRGSYKWISFRGQIVNDTLVYGNIQLSDTIIATSSPVLDSIGSVFFEFEITDNTDQSFRLNMSLTKN